MTHRLDSRALAQFVAVAQTLSFRQAAERLHIAQPPLSRAIRQLEDRLGVPLFERDTRGVALTAAGQRLLPQAERILALLERAHAQMRALAQQRPRLRLGLTSAVEPQSFAPLLQALQRRRSAIEVETRFDSSPRLARLLAGGRLDAALVALPLRAPGLVLTKVARQPMRLALPAAHHLARRRSVSLAEIDGEPLLWFERARQPAFFDHCMSVFEAHGFRPRRVREPQDHHVLLAEVAAGRGAALLPASFAALKHAGVRYKPLREGDELALGIGLATPPDATELQRLLLRSCAAMTREAS